MARVAQKFENIAFVASEVPEARSALAALAELYGNVPTKDADAIVALGGDGLMLQTLHKHMHDRIPIYGMNRGSVGFLTNDYHVDDLRERLPPPEINTIHPLAMRAVDSSGKVHDGLAINEVHLFRETYQAAKLRISVD